VEPALAVATVLKERGANVIAIGTNRGLETRLVPARGFDLKLIEPVPIPRKPSIELLEVPFKLVKSIAQTRKILKKHKADVLIGFGGYVSTPAYLAARKAGVPVVIHEQNARPGLANRLGASWAQAVALTFASTRLKASKGCTEVTGLPLRPAIATLVSQRATDEGARRARVEGAQALGLDPDLPTLLVTGGSLGAQHLNEVLSESLGSLPAGLQVLHLTGKDKDAPVRAALEAAVASGAAQDLAERYHVLDYLTTMEQAYACADGVLCRSGAGTVAEITALGLPALYVPLPIGNGEQRLNAADVLASGGGRMVLDAELKPSDILDFAMLISDPERQAAMARAAASTGVQDAAARLAALIRQCASIHDTPTDEENAA